MRKLLVLLLSLPILLIGCGGGDSTPTPTATLADSGSIKEPAQSDRITPVATSTPGEGGAPVSNETFVFQSSADGMTMKGHLYSVQGPKRKVVILAHGANEDQRVWQDFARELALKGIAAVTFDFRGYGETGGSRDPSKITGDLEVAVRYLKSLDYPLVYIVGSDLGGTAALKVAASQELAGVATLSAQAMIANVDATSDIPQVVEPKIFIASSGDTVGSMAIFTLAQAATDPKMTKVIDNTSAKGAALLQVEAARQAVLNFIGSP